MKIIVTGGCGFIGSHFIDSAVQQNDEIIVIDNLLAGSEKNLENANTSGNVKLLKNDILHLDEIQNEFYNADGIIHFAARTGVIESLEKPKEFSNVNVLGTLNLLELCRKFSIPNFILASTGAVYGNHKAPFKEDMIPDPISPYAASKVSAENYCISYANTFGIKSTILRFTNVYGPRKSFGPYANVIPKFVRAALRNEPITIFGDGSQERDFIFVKDIANACYASFKSKKFGTYNVGTGTNTSLNDLLEILESTLDYKFERNYVDFRDGEAKYAYSLITKAENELGFIPKYSLKDGIKEYVEYEKTQL